jgi:hypothetical protein
VPLASNTHLDQRRVLPWPVCTLSQDEVDVRNLFIPNTKTFVIPNELRNLLSADSMEEADSSLRSE